MILDIVFFAVILLFLVLGVIFGFFKTLVSFLGWAVCIFIAYLLAKAVANALLTAGIADRLVGGAIYDGVYGLIPDKLKDVSLYEIRQMLRTGKTAEEVGEYIKSQSGGLLGFVSSIIQGAICKEMYLNSALQNAGQVLALELTYQIYVILVGVAIFVVLRILVMGVSIIFNSKLRGRKVKVWERFAGMGLGAVRGFAYACLLLMVFNFIAGFSSALKKQSESSKVSVPVTAWINDATSKVLSRDNEDNGRYLNLIEALENRLREENNS